MFLYVGLGIGSLCFPAQADILSVWTASQGIVRSCLALTSSVPLVIVGSLCAAQAQVRGRRGRRGREKNEREH